MFMWFKGWSVTGRFFIIPLTSVWFSCRFSGSFRSWFNSHNNLILILHRANHNMLLESLWEGVTNDKLLITKQLALRKTVKKLGIFYN